jgi:hypothetical protein
MKNNNDGASNPLIESLRGDRTRAKTAAKAASLSNNSSSTAGSKIGVATEEKFSERESKEDKSDSKIEENPTPFDSEPIGQMDEVSSGGGSGSLTLGNSTYTVTKSNGDVASSPESTFAVNDVNRLSSADHTGGPMMKDLIGKGTRNKKKEDGASFRLFGIGKLSDGQKRRRGISDDSGSKSTDANKSSKEDMSSKKQKVGDLRTSEIGGSIKRSTKSSTKAKSAGKSSASSAKK